MPSSPKRTAVPPEATAAAIALLAARGYEATTVGELADAAKMSRSTFFRRFGSKEDVVFADHAVLIERLRDFLASTTLEIPEALSRGSRMVLDHHLGQPEVSRLRHGLLRAHPQLRDRELVFARRYERTFTAYLSRRTPPGTPGWSAVALASATVAVHNAILRRWLREDGFPAAEALDRELGELIATFAPVIGGQEPSDAPTPPAGPPASGGSRVLVAVYDTEETPAEILRGISARLQAQQAPTANQVER